MTSPELSPSPPLVLAVDDEPQLRRFLRATLAANGYRLVEAASAADALREAATRAPDLILLDLGLPDLDGVEVTRRLRAWTSTPIIVLSVRDQERDKVEALDAGADDYLTKPFGSEELLARMRVALRHATRAPEQPVYEFEDLRLDLAAHRVFVQGREVRLTRTEYRILALLAKHAGKVVTHRQLLKEVWGPGSVDHTHYLRVYMAQLRGKVEADPARPRYLLTEIGVGYRLRSD